MVQPRIIYVYDALCGWCYGFSPVIRRLHDTYQDQFTFDVMSGGMMTGPRIQPISESMGYIKSALRIVEENTGVLFGEAYVDNILNPGTYLSDSNKPGQAMTLFRVLQTGRDIEFAATLQNALYRDGIDLNVDANYGPLVETYDVDPDEFVAHLNDEAIIDQTQQEFALVAQMGINGFPSVIVEKGEELFLVARGYLPYDDLMANISRATGMEL
ncbi:DsbA family protein [Fibrella rubiginis]|nr:DsbA family protein [Fibrella rubiginis]